MPDSVRHLHSLKENMDRYRAELLQIVDRVRIVCNEAGTSEFHCPLGKECGFYGGKVPTLGCDCGIDDIMEILNRGGKQ